MVSPLSFETDCVFKIPYVDKPQALHVAVCSFITFDGMSRFGSYKRWLSSSMTCNNGQFPQGINCIRRNLPAEYDTVPICDCGWASEHRVN